MREVVLYDTYFEHLVRSVVVLILYSLAVAVAHPLLLPMLCEKERGHHDDDVCICCCNCNCEKESNKPSFLWLEVG